MASILLSLPDNLLDAIINFLLASSFQAATDTALFLVCRKFYTRAMRLVYKYHDTSRYSGLSLLRLARLLDADFDSRVAEYVTSNLNITTTFVPPSPEASLYPYNPSNFFANATGPLFRRHIVTFRLFTRWETGCDILPTWTSSARGIPFASVPVFLDLLRLRFPGMRAMWVDLPRSIIVTASQQIVINLLVRDIMERLGRFGLLERLILDAWVLTDVSILPITESCASLEVLTLRRAKIGLSTFASVGQHHSISKGLRRLTLRDATMEPIGLHFLLATCLGLSSLQLLAVQLENHNSPTSDVIVDAFCCKRRYTANPSFAPIQSLVFRPSYRTRSRLNDADLVFVFSLILSLSSTLCNLHVGTQITDTICLLPLASNGYAPYLRRLWIGFMCAEDEVGDGRRLSVADDQRVRIGLSRDEVEYLDDRDPLEGPLDSKGRVPPLSPAELREAKRSGALFNERIVLGRLSLDEMVVQSLVSNYELPWPPVHLPAYRILLNLLQPFPILLSALSLRRQSNLKQLNVFETEYVGSLAREEERLLQSQQTTIRSVGGQGSQGSREIAWEALMLGNYGL